VSTAAPAAGFRTFSLADLTEFTADKQAIPADADHWVFYVGRDDVHGVLKALLSRVAVSLVGNMFGYDDDELNGIIWSKVEDASVFTRFTLDHSQSGGVHEKQILASDIAKDAAAFNAHFAIIETATGQISHTKGGVLDGLVSFEGSTNWSASGEGTFISGATAPGGAGYKAQNNTLAVFVDPVTSALFRSELDAEFHSAKVYAAAAAT
jgi:hypothetical protein